MVARPWRSREWWWPAAGACLLVAAGLLPVGAALRAVAAGWDVYLFIGGMMLLADLARREGVFDWLAAHAVEWARRSPRRLFAIVYAVGAFVTVFMSNDATAVVLTPAVAAASRRAGASPLPLLFACAMVANAASFVLPISNPANLVLFDGALPGLLPWLRQFGLAALVATLATYAALRLAFRKDLAGACEGCELPVLSVAGRAAAVTVVLAALALLAASARGEPLGPPAAIVSALGVAAVCLLKREGPRAVLAEVSWSSLVLVAALFTIVRALEHTGVVALLARAAVSGSGRGFDVGAGVLAALACNAMNNLPAGMLAAATLSAAHAGAGLRASVAVAVDLGPNLSLFGSLSSVLWLLAVRREGVHVSAWRFAGVGLMATPVALVAALLLV